MRLGPPIDIYLNDTAYFRAVSASVWQLAIGGYQVFKKWLSYREQDVLGRPVTPAEIREGASIVRRLAALIVMGPDLDANYEAARNRSYTWQDQEL